MSEHDPSVHHIQTPAPPSASVSHAQFWAALFAVVVSSSMVVLTTDFSPRGGQFMPSVVRPCSCCCLITLHIGALEEGKWCISFSLPLHAFVSLAANRCCLASIISAAGVRPDCHIGVPRAVVGNAPIMDLACRLRRRWRSSHLPTSLGSHQSSLPSSATAWTHAAWTVFKLSRTTPYVLVTVRRLPSASWLSSCIGWAAP